MKKNGLQTKTEGNTPICCFMLISILNNRTCISINCYYNYFLGYTFYERKIALSCFRASRISLTSICCRGVTCLDVLRKRVFLWLYLMILKDRYLVILQSIPSSRLIYQVLCYNSTLCWRGKVTLGHRLSSSKVSVWSRALDNVQVVLYRYPNNMSSNHVRNNKIKKEICMYE